MEGEKFEGMKSTIKETKSNFFEIGFKNFQEWFEKENIIKGTIYFSSRWSEYNFIRMYYNYNSEEKAILDKTHYCANAPMVFLNNFCPDASNEDSWFFQHEIESKGNISYERFNLVNELVDYLRVHNIDIVCDEVRMTNHPTTKADIDFQKWRESMGQMKQK